MTIHVTTVNNKSIGRSLSTGRTFPINNLKHFIYVAVQQGIKVTGV